MAKYVVYFPSISAARVLRSVEVEAEHVEIGADKSAALYDSEKKLVLYAEKVFMIGRKVEMDTAQVDVPAGAS